MEFKGTMNYTVTLLFKRLRWSRVSALPLSTQVRGFKLGRSRQDFQGRKILSAPSFGGEVKPSVPCRRFTACKRLLNVAWKSTFRQNDRLIFSPTSSTLRCLDLSRRLGRGDIWRRKQERLKHKGG
jgi:hypothetical protein